MFQMNIWKQQNWLTKDLPTFVNPLDEIYISKRKKKQSLKASFSQISCDNE